jgi:two-component system chemotaxis response regulator CheB
VKKIKVFIVEDSILMQKILRDILLSDPHIEIVGNTRFGKEALEKIPQFSPDIVTLDINLPDMDGLAVLKKIMEGFPTRVVMLSAYTQKGADTTLRALELGAMDFIPKPSGEVSLDLYKFKEEIISKVKLVATIDLNKFICGFKGIAPHKEVLSIEKIAVIGASVGGPAAILEIMSQLPSSIDASFLIVQHMPIGFTKSFAERISWYSEIKAKEAEEGDVLFKSAVYVAPSGFHMVIEKIQDQKHRYCIRLDDSPFVNYVRPAVDVTMSSVAEVFEGTKILGVILSGMGRDGLGGARKIKERGGKIIAQDESSCAVYGMPKVVIDEGLADEVLRLDQIPKKIVQYLS